MNVRLTIDTEPNVFTVTLMLLNFKIISTVGGPFTFPAQVSNCGIGSYEDMIADAIARRNHCVCTDLTDNVNGVYEAKLSKSNSNYDFKIVGSVFFKVEVDK